ncbi:MAG: toxin-antitoxin system HicB family antitoxin [Alphaproteobacteria bacterium]|nr:toxin-antitoxin system HicB family antitoxin [Alphaproteobacteria bacterium]
MAEISREEGTSINQFVALAVAEKVSAMRTAEFFAAKRDEADIEAALQILRRRDGQPPNSDDGYPHEQD